MRRSAFLLLLVGVGVLSVGACMDSPIPRAVVTGVVLDEDGQPAAGVDVMVGRWVDPGECVDDPDRRFLAESRDDGTFALSVRGLRGVRQQEACLVAWGSRGVFFGGSGWLFTTLRADSPFDTVHVELTLYGPPPP